MWIYSNKTTNKNTHAPAVNPAAQLQDNRPQAAIQKQQVDALADKATVQKQANNTGLPDNLKSGIEDLSGHGMDDVKVHYNSDKPAQLNAHAYAQGTDIHIASGQEKHLPHEAWHVVQQKQGRVKPTMQMKGKVNVNDDDGLEKEADVMGARALQRKQIQFPHYYPITSGPPVVQRIPFWKKALTGATMLGGAAALTAGAMLSSPALAVGGGAAVLGSALYAGYKGYHERRRSNALNTVNQELAQYDPVANPNVAHNPAAAGRSQTAFIAPPGALPGGPPVHAGLLPNRQYRIDINPNNPTGENVTDADMINSAMVHEQTHIANDQSYDSNIARTTDRAPENITLAEGLAIGGAADPTVVIDQRVQALRQTVQEDRQVPDQWRQYIRNRLEYIVQGMNPVLEYDTVVNELLHFMNAKNIEADSPTAQGITRMAEENSARR